MGAILDRARSSPLLRTRALRQLTLANGLVGLSASIALPFTPLFLARRVGATATEIGLLLTLSGIAGVVVSSLVGPLSDRLPSRKPLIAAGCLSAAACDAIYALSSSYPVVLAASVTLLAGAWVGVPQLYARGRELLEAAGAAPALSLSALRSAVSLAWIVGPPLAGVLLTVSGFPQAFLLASASLVAAAVLAVADGERDVRRSTEPPRPSGKASSSFPRWGAAAAALALSVGAVVLLQTANTLGVTTMPLLLTTTMHGTPSQVGAVFGLSAGLEIPIMLWLGWSAGRFGSLRVMLLSWCVGLLYFGTVAVAGSTWQVVAAQVLSAVYVAGLVGVGVVYFQELLDAPGSASTLYFNGITAGSTVAGVLWAAVVVVAGYRGAFAASVVLTALGIVLLGAGHRLRQRRAA